MTTTTTAAPPADRVDLADHALPVPQSDPARIQEVHPVLVRPTGDRTRERAAA